MGRAHILLCAGALLCGSGVISGAWGAHGLSAHLAAQNLPAAPTPWDTAVLYQLVHGLAVLILSVWTQLRPSRLFAISGWLLIGGVVLFSGSLYGLTLGGPRWLGPVTPLGGTLLISGWLTLAAAAWRMHRSV